MGFSHEGSFFDLINTSYRKDSFLCPLAYIHNQCVWPRSFRCRVKRACRRLFKHFLAQYHESCSLRTGYREVKQTETRRRWLGCDDSANVPNGIPSCRFNCCKGFRSIFLIIRGKNRDKVVEIVCISQVIPSRSCLSFKAGNFFEPQEFIICVIWEIWPWTRAQRAMHQREA